MGKTEEACSEAAMIAMTHEVKYNNLNAHICEQDQCLCSNVQKDIHLCVHEQGENCMQGRKTEQFYKILNEATGGSSSHTKVQNVTSGEYMCLE